MHVFGEMTVISDPDVRRHALAQRVAQLRAELLICTDAPRAMILYDELRQVQNRLMRED